MKQRRPQRLSLARTQQAALKRELGDGELMGLPDTALGLAGTHPLVDQLMATVVAGDTVVALVVAARVVGVHRELVCERLRLDLGGMEADSI